MCGVVSIVYRKTNPRLGREAASLLKKLEYRGYDSTGAAFFREDGTIRLLKKVGSPTKVIQELEIEKFSGYKFIGQVRWATYGSVTDVNAQPHEMCCRVHMAGAHNGNISNTDSLKEYLREHRHEVLSDNDGEMLIHVVEHYYADVVAERPPITEQDRIESMVEAIRLAHRKVQGSYAACVSLPDIGGVFAMKAGSSLYAGKGSDGAGDFIVVSSDLTSVLSKTRFLIPLAEGDALYFTAGDYFVFPLGSGDWHRPSLVRSRLNIADISLQSKYSFFMDQEIHSTGANLNSILKYYFSDEEENAGFAFFERFAESCDTVIFDLFKLYEIFQPEELKAAMERLFASPEFQAIRHQMVQHGIDLNGAKWYPRFSSDESQLLRELLEFGDEYYEHLRLIDLMIVWKKKRIIIASRRELVELLRSAQESGSRVFLVGAGTSYHAALVAGCFFNECGGPAVIPANPGLFRSVFLNTLKPGDLVIGITQSGETKDLLDIYNEIREIPGRKIKLVSIVNNENSTIPQEKSDFYLPILCGPEIAVAATKSFISQIAIFYLLALFQKLPESAVREKLKQVQQLIDFTLSNVEDEVSEVALKLFLKPSIHILGTSLIGLAKEGALKVREVVLNHTEGYDSAEFKHGPNTILGRNTIFSLTDLEKLLDDLCEFFKDLTCGTEELESCDPESISACLDLIRSTKFKSFPNNPGNGSADGQVLPGLTACYDRFRESVTIDRYFNNYPLIFICPPDERNRRITISQIHTHKIRGADVVLIARDDEDLRKAVEGKPTSLESYYTKFIRIPTMYGSDTFVFSAAVVLQLLAFKMSVAKMRYLNRLRMENHGVHPDVPKNVSKSITVD